MAGEGPMKETIIDLFAENNLSDLLYTVGILNADEVADAYNAMDVFAFASKSETQGMVITEAMAGGAPVVAIDAPGVREVVRDGINGRLLDSENIDEFTNALEWIHSKPEPEIIKLQKKQELPQWNFQCSTLQIKLLNTFKSFNKNLSSIAIENITPGLQH